MTITRYAEQLAHQIRRAESPDDPAVARGLQLAIAAWLDGARTGHASLQWGLFGTGVQAIQDSLCPQSPASTIEIDASALTDERQTVEAVSNVVTAVADLLTRLSTTSPHGAAHATAAVQLRDAVQDLP